MSEKFHFFTKFHQFREDNPLFNPGDNGDKESTRTVLSNIKQELQTSPGNMASFFDVQSTKGTPSIIFAQSLENPLSATDPDTLVTSQSNSPALSIQPDETDIDDIPDGEVESPYDDIRPDDPNAFIPSALLGVGQVPFSVLQDFQVHMKDIGFQASNPNQEILFDPVIGDDEVTPPLLIRIDPDTGFSQSDLITKSPSFDVVGSGPINSVIRVFVDGEFAGSGQSDLQGSFTIPISLSQEGSYEITIDAQRDGLTSDLSTPTTIVVDTTQPTPVVDSIDIDSNNPNVPGTDADFVTNDTDPTVNITVEPNAFVTASLNGQVLGTFQADPDGLLVVNLGNISLDGAYTLALDSIDIAGNVGQTVTQNIVIDTVTDRPTIDLQALSDSGESNNDDLTNVSSPAFSGTAEANSTIEIFLNGTSVGMVTTDAQGTYNFTLFNLQLSDGFYDLTATSTDLAGNTADTDQPLTIEIDRTVSVDIQSSSANDGFINALELQNFVVSGTTDLGTDANKPNILTLELIDNSNTVVFSTDSITAGGINLLPDNTWSFNGDLSNFGISDGSDYILRITAVDPAGNTDTVQQTNIVIDTQINDPTLNLSDRSDSSDVSILGQDAQGTNMDDVTNVVRPVLNGTSDPGTTIEIFDDNNVSLGSTVADQNGNWQLQITQDLSEGTTTLIARATDPAGNTADSTQLDTTLDTRIAEPTLDLPTTSDTGSSDTDNLVNTPLIPLEGTAEPNSTIQIFRSGDTTPLATTTTAQDGTWSISNLSLDEGANTLFVQSTDAAGNTDTSEDLVITLDTQLPTATINIQSNYTVLNAPDLGFNTLGPERNNFSYLDLSSSQSVRHVTEAVVDPAQGATPIIVPAQTPGPQQGFILISNEAETLDQSTMVSELGLSATAFSDVSDSGAELSDGSYARYSIYAQVGDVITFDWNFINAENRTSQNPKNDHAFVVINGQVIQLSSSDDLNILNTDGSLITHTDQSGWQTYSFTVTEAGTQNLAFVVYNEGVDPFSGNSPDFVADSALAIDNIAINGSNVQTQEIPLNLSIDFDTQSGATLSSITVDASDAPMNQGLLTLTNDNGGTGITQIQNNVWVLDDESALQGLRLVHPERFNRSFDLHVSLTIEDAAGNQTTTSSTSHVTIRTLDQSIYDTYDSNERDYAVGTDGDDTILGGRNRDIIDGGLGDDTLRGGNSTDILIGGPGNDTMRGDGGRDLFVFEAGDQGTVGSPAVDRIDNFQVGRDTVDLRGLLDGESVDNLTDYLSVNFASNTTTFEIKSQGAGGDVDQIIEFSNVDLVGSNSTQQDIVSSLLQQGVIAVDA